MITYLRFAAVALIPALINTALAVHFFTTPARNSLPYYNDEIAYWNQVATFREAGFDGGENASNVSVRLHRCLAAIRNAG